MKPFTAKARAMSLAELKGRREVLKRTISESCSELDAVDRELRRQKRARRKSAAVAAIVAGLLVAIPCLADVPPVAPSAQPELLLIEHTYEGPVERAGVLMRWQYTGGRMLVEWSDTTTDGIFRNGFEAAP